MVRIPFLVQFSHCVSGAKAIRSDALSCKREDRSSTSNPDDELLRNRERVMLSLDKFDVELYQKLTNSESLCPANLMTPLNEKPIDDIIDAAYNRSDMAKQLIAALEDLFTTNWPKEFRKILRVTMQDCRVHNKRIYLRDKLWVPPDDELKVQIIFRTHSSGPAGHPGRTKTIDLVSRNYWWPQMHKEIGAYVQACELCVRTKSSKASPPGFLQPLPVPFRVWSDISIDYITPLPDSKHYDSTLSASNLASPVLQTSQKREFFKGNKTADRMERVLDQLRALAKQAISEYEDYANRRRSESPRYIEGQKVYVNTKNMKTSRKTKKLDDKILERDDDAEEPVQKWVFEGVLDNHDEDGHHYLVQWKHYAPTWQPAKDLKGNEKVLVEYHRLHPEKPGPPAWVLAHPEAKSVLPVAASPLTTSLRRSKRDRKSLLPSNQPSSFVEYQHISEIVEKECQGIVPHKCSSPPGGHFSVLLMFGDIGLLHLLVLEATGDIRNGINVYHRVGILKLRYISPSSYASPELYIKIKNMETSITARLGLYKKPRMERTNPNAVFMEVKEENWGKETVMIV
ncbi:hypothetical protein SBOR_7827 [Sclerotinia borealis F-4128]|uniref:Chromo domain-containing protein n=1 Tax=Sclerotinia borealis (strain F-4128) TaxID=1432307 RepID=W9CAC2_SCLBF|nr:hypothetical protein SBOR_7827 [Sclerotinia borealis F-4128]